MNTDDYLKFDTEKLDLDDFNFNISSTIPEHELLEFTSFDSHNVNNNHNDLTLNPNSTSNNNNNNRFVDTQSQSQSQSQNISNINPSSLTHNYYLKPGDDDDELPTTHLNPNQLSTVGSLTNDYLSPVGSPYSSTSFQPQSIQQSLSQSLQRQRHGSISNSISNSFQQRHESIYDNLDSISSPQPHNLTDISSNSAYFSPATNKMGLNNPGRTGSISINSIASPSSYNDSIALSPYNSSFDPSSFKSPKSLALSPVTGSSLTSQSLPKSQLTKDDKLKRRREFHNQVERRRRDLIKEKIKELGLIVPPSLLYVDSEGKEVKASKSVIINRTVDYVAHLHKVMEEQEKRKAILVQKIGEIEKEFGALTTNTDNAGTITSVTPQSASGYTNNNDNNDSAPATNSSFNSPVPDIKIENEYNDNAGLLTNNTSRLEFDVNEFLRDHNQTWNHSDI